MTSPAPSCMPGNALQDKVGDDTPGAREIGFRIPDGYNASAVLFDNLDKGRGADIAILSDQETLTYEALCERACRFGNGLLSLGLAPGERVLCCLDDTPAYPAAIFGAIRAGLVPMLINTLSTRDLIGFFLEDSGARVAIVEADLLELFDEATVKGAALEVLIVVNAEGSGQIAAPAGVAVHRAEDWLAGFSAVLQAAPTGRDDMAFWMYSSGSTGRPKGVVHLQHDMAYIALSYADRILRLSPGDICFSVPKIFFAYGFGNSLVFPFTAGASAVLMAGRPTPAAVFRTIARHRPTVFFGLPTLYTALIKDPAAEDADLHSVRLCISAAETLSADVFGAWRERFGHQIVEGLGSTEVLHIYLSNTQEQKKLGSAGMAVPGYEVKLTDRDGHEVGPGEEGIMWVRGHSSAPCYWNRPDKTAETMRQGWIWTGDRFTVDADGFYTFKGRADDLIKVSGQWVYPLEIELCLAEHPAVLECAVLGLEMADRRMTTKAFVVLNPGSQGDAAMTRDLQAFAKQALLPHKYPRQIEYLGTLPKTGTGKIDRQALKARPSS